MSVSESSARSIFSKKEVFWRIWSECLAR